ncbi:MAG: hypothetical protein CMG64_04110 [Candidatus Marinimicrobia bacterium]|nr:hypothetical protein [Candidatus Neomarinimicrobiota bacterium]
MEILNLNFKEEINFYKKSIDSKLKTVYLDGPKIIRDPIHYILQGGKRIRPILFQLVVDAFKNSQEDDVLNVALSIELFHNFTLIHDDIMDNDSLRHGIETIHSKWNESVAILSGDAMLALALNLLDNLSINKNLIINRFHNALIEVCEGQALDISYQDKNDIGIENYMKMIDKKTGFMIGLSSELGAILSSRNQEECDKLKEYGQLIGRAFQIQDDLLEIVSESSIMGKTLDSDFLLNKKTYLLIKSNEINSPKINSIINSTKKNNDEMFQDYKKFLYDEGIISITEKHIKEILEEANHILSDLNIDTSKLYSFTELILNRKK